MPAADAALITLAGFPLSQVDPAGVEWVVGNVDGWDSAEVRYEPVARPSAHGSFDDDAYYDARKVTVEGTIYAPTVAARRLAEQALSTVTAALDSVTLRVDEPPYARQCQVKRSGRLQLTQLDQLTHYSLPLLAADPRRYSVDGISVSTGLPSDGVGLSWPMSFPFSFGASGTGGALAVTNLGDIASPAVFTITGPVLNPVLRNNTTGDELRLGIDLPAGSFLTIDTGEHTVLLDGTANRRNTVLTGSRWPVLVPGVNSLLFRASAFTSDASLTVRYRSAWA